MPQDLLNKPPKTGGHGERYWVGLLTEAGEFPVQRVPLQNVVCFRLPHGARQGAIAFVGIYREPTGRDVESLYEMPFENPPIAAGNFLTLTLYTDKKNG